MLHDCINGIKCFLLCHGDDDTLSGRKAVGFDNNWGSFAANIRTRSFRLSKDLIAGSWNPVLLHEILRKRFRALDLCCVCTGAKGRNAGSFEIVYKTVHQGDFRADNDETDVLLLGKLQDRRIIGDSDIRHLTHARIAGNRIYALCLRAFGELPKKSMLTAA